jgi:iron complex outermembrane receptor protein
MKYRPLKMGEPMKRYTRLRGALLGAAALGMSTASVAEAPAAAPDGASATAPDASATTDPGSTIIVTGIRGGKPRTVAESPAPIDVIQGDQISGTGRADVAESLSKLLPSIGFGTTTAGVNSIVRPIFNRGLGPAYTLVLVNGKRRHNGALLTNGGGDTSGINPVDFDQLAASSIAYIEVLKDSAAAQYGSDAVAGVVNIVLKSQDHSGHIGLLGGSLYDGSGNLKTFKAEADIGFRLGDGGFLHLSADARKRGLSWSNFYAANLPFSPASNPKNANWSGDGAHNGDPEIKSYSTNYNAELPVSDTVTLYSYGSFAQRRTVIGNNFRRPNSTADINQIFSDGFYPLNNTAETDFQLLGGAKGELGDTHWDVSTTFGRDHVRQYSDLTINPSLGSASPPTAHQISCIRWLFLLDTSDPNGNRADLHAIGLDCYLQRVITKVLPRRLGSPWGGRRAPLHEILAFAGMTMGLYRSLEIFSPSSFARAWIDSSLRVSALPIAFSAMPLAARRWSFWISSEVQGCLWRTNPSAMRFSVC